MQHKTKKRLLISTASFMVLTSAIAGLSIYFNTPNATRIPEKDLYVVRLNSKPDTNGYKYDTSYNSGPNSSLSVNS